MKIRNGFVSNSSSTSFLVTINGTDAKIQFKIDADLSKYGTVITTEDELTKAFRDFYWDDFENDDYVMQNYRKALEAIKNNKIVVLGTVSNEDEAIGGFLYEQGVPSADGMEIIF